MQQVNMLRMEVAKTYYNPLKNLIKQAEEKLVKIKWIPPRSSTMQ